MKNIRLGELCILVAMVVCLAATVFAQESASSASVSRSRAITTANILSGNATSPSSVQYGSPRPAPVFVTPDEIAVEEFINYHRHRLPLPRAGQGVALDVRWGNDQIGTSQRDAVMQVGFTTAHANDRTDLRPVNLTLVIDKSGSMAESDKMSRVKESLQTMLAKLRPEDIVSIVVFDSTAAVLFPASPIGDGRELRHAIDCIEPGGSTNLHAGLMLGYKEQAKNFRKGATNRVIMLTDGIANVGVVKPEQIAAESSEYNATGIDLSTIGVGLDLNNDLLRTLARSGRGLYHFVSDYHDIEKVFVQEVQSLLSSVAKSVEVTIDHDPGLEIAKIYGYAPRAHTNGVSIPLENMNSGLTQVVMLRFKVRNPVSGSYRVKVRLSYFDVVQKRNVEEVQNVVLTTARGNEHCDLLADAEVKKNATIAELAQSLFDMTASAKQQHHAQALDLLNASLDTVYQRYPNMEDTDLRFIVNIVEGYRRDLQAFRQSSDRRDCGSCH